MRHYLRIAFMLLSMTSNNALSATLKADAPPVIVKIEDYNFEYQQLGNVKAFVEASAAEEEGVSYHSVVLSYTLKGTDIVESPTLLASLSKAAKDRCNELASGSADGDIVSTTRTVSPWMITGKFICALK